MDVPYLPRFSSSVSSSDNIFNSNEINAQTSQLRNEINSMLLDGLRSYGNVNRPSRIADHFSKSQYLPRLVETFLFHLFLERIQCTYFELCFNFHKEYKGSNWKDFKDRIPIIDIDQSAAKSGFHEQLGITTGMEEPHVLGKDDV